jgi:hypothetical protein
MGLFLEPTDVPSIDSAVAVVLIEDAEALAVLAAPCLADLDQVDPKFNAARAILRGVVLRWSDAGSGAVTQQAAGPFSQTITPQVRRNSFWPSELRDLQRICKVNAGKAYSVDTAPTLVGIHAPWCSLYFGGTTCSCGADIAGAPIYEPYF